MGITLDLTTPCALSTDGIVEINLCWKNTVKFNLLARKVVNVFSSHRDAVVDGRSRVVNYIDRIHCFGPSLATN